MAPDIDSLIFDIDGSLVSIDSALFNIDYRQTGDGGYDPAKENTRFVFFGASIMDAAVSDTAAFASQIESATGYTNIQVVDYAIPGDTTTDLKNRIDANLATLPDPGTESHDTYCLIHIGGNNVTNTRPYSSTTQAERDAITNDITYVLNAITAKGYIPVLGELSFRDYNGTTVLAEEAGSDPYNTNLIHPLVDAAWAYVDGTPWLQFYNLIYNNYDTYLQADGIHLTASGYEAWRQHIINTVCKFVLNGSAPTQITKNDYGVLFAPVLIDFGGGTVSGNWNQVRNTDTTVSSLIDENGLATGLSLTVDVAFNDENTGGTTSSTVYPSWATQTSLFGNTGLFGGKENVFPEFTISGLSPSKTYDIVFYASRAGVSDNREARYTVTGAGSSFVDLNASNNVDTTVTALAVSPNVSGEISVAITPGPNNDNAPTYFTYLGLIEISEND